MAFPEKAPCAYPVFYRTYSRTKDGVRETWEQMCDRALAGLKELGQLTPEEYSLIENELRSHHTYASGRWFWVGGTTWVENPQNVLGAYNCVSIQPDGFEDFGLLADLAMQGCGTGAVLEPFVLDKLPIITRKLSVTTLGKPGDVPASERIDRTIATDPIQDMVITVGDSREGWVDAYTALLKAATSSPVVTDEPLPVVVVLGHVRPLGEPLQGFGGVANPVELPPLFERVAEITNEAHGRRLDFVKACLVIDEMAKTIVAGNLRRCLPEDALVHTSHGLVPIKDVAVGDMVQTPIGFRRVTNKFDQGVQDVYEIPCNHPVLPRATLNHQMAVVAEGGDLDYGWKTVSTLVQGDLLLYSTYDAYFPEAGVMTNSSVCVLDSPKLHSKIQTYDIEVEEAHCFYCDGYLTHNSAGIRQGGEAAATSKEGLWQQNEQGDWSIDPKRDALRMANHTRVFHYKPTLEEVIAAVRKNYGSGEGAIQYAPEAVARCSPDLVLDRASFFAAYEEGKAAEYLQKSALEQGIELEPGELEHRLRRYGLNPCGEVIGSDFACNLSEVNLNTLDPEDIEAQLRAFKAAAVNICSLLYHKFPYPKMQKSRRWDPIVAACPTGFFDFFVKAFGRSWLEWWQAGRPKDWGKTVLWTPLFSSFSQSTVEEMQLSEFFLTREREYMTLWREVVKEAMIEFCDRRGLKRPNRFTSVQPSGTKALLTGASPGWHPPKAARFIRRISMRREEPVALACRDYGYNIVPAQSAKDENGKLLDDPMDPRCKEWLVEIPVEVPWASLAEGIDLSQFSALAQFDFYMQVQRYYTTHNTSATLELREPEIEPLAKAIHDAMEHGYISAAILARFDDLESFPRLPFEPIDEATYERMRQEVLDRRTEPDFEKALAYYDAQGAIQMVAGPAPCDSGGCLLK